MAINGVEEVMESAGPTPTRAELAEYVEAMLTDVRDIVPGKQFQFLRYLIDMAREEARRARLEKRARS